MPKLQFIKTLKKKGHISKMSHTDAFEDDFIFFVLLCVFLGLLNICYYNMTENRFIMKINSTKGTENVSV